MIIRTHYKELANLKSKFGKESYIYQRRCKSIVNRYLKKNHWQSLLMLSKDLEDGYLLKCLKEVILFSSSDFCVDILVIDYDSAKIMYFKRDQAMAVIAVLKRRQQDPDLTWMLSEEFQQQFEEELSKIIEEETQ